MSDYQDFLTATDGQEPRLLRTIQAIPFLEGDEEESFTLRNTHDHRA